MALSRIEHNDIERISLQDPTFDQIVQCIVDARDRNAKCFVTFGWPEEQLDNLESRLDDRLRQLDTIAPQRFEYDFQSKTVHLDMAETTLHSQFGCFSALLFMFAIDRLVPSIQDPAIRLLLKAIVNFTTRRLSLKGKLRRQADWAFGRATDHLPALVCETSFSQSWENVQAKVVQYIKSSNGMIRAGIIFNIEYPEANIVTLAETLYNDDVDEQPTGHIDLYLSDVAGLAGLPLSYCRPSADERDAGILRQPQIIVTYDQLRDTFLKARKMHRGEACLEDYAQETHFEEMVRHIAEEKGKMAEEMALRMTEKDREMAEEMALRMAEKDREMAEEKGRMAKEMAMRMAEKDREMAEEMALRTAEKDREMAEKNYQSGF